MKRSIKTTSPEETMNVAYRLCQLIKDKPLPFLVLLFGDLGAGKTTFIKGMAKCLHLNPDDIGSASFVIMVEHDSIPPLYHIDLYRLNTDDELDTIGIWDYLNEEAIVVIEWAEHITISDKPSVRVTIEDVDETTRNIIIEGLNEEDWSIL